MKVHEGKEFAHWFDRDSGAVFSDLEFRRCEFHNCHASITYDPRLRSTVRNIALIGCSALWADPGNAIVDNVLVDGLCTPKLLQTWAAVFRHVTLRGKIGRVMLSGILGPIREATPSRQRAFAEANAEYYKTVDWALDISRAEFQECDIRGIPARLIRRDPETQVVVTRQKAAEGRWRELDLSRTYWAGYLDPLASGDNGDADVVLAAPKGAPNFGDLVEGLRLLRREGVAEPD